MAGKRCYTEDVIVYPAPVYIPHKSIFRQKALKVNTGGVHTKFNDCRRYVIQFFPHV
jgi:hypothetical protein